MSIGKWICILLALGCLGSGLKAAWLWYRASKVGVDPGWSANPLMEPVDEDQKNSGWIAGIITSSSESADLNKHASLWTAASVMLGSISNVIGSLPF